MLVKAIYKDIYESLLSSLRSGEYPYQSFIPPESHLVEKFQCSHNTVRRALAMLAQQGYVHPVHGKGVRVTYLAHERAPFELGGLETFAEAAQRNRLDTVTEVPVFEEVACDERMAVDSGFPEGAGLWHLKRVRRIDGKALILDDNYFLQQAVPGLTREIAEKSVFAYLEGPLGMHVAMSKRTVTVEPVGEDDERYLDLEGFDCLAVVTNHVFDSEGLMFEYTRSRHRPDYFSFSTVAMRDVR